MSFVINYCSGDGNGVQDATPRQLLYVLDEGKRLFPNAKCMHGTFQNYFQIMVLAMTLGCNILRVALKI